MICERFYTALLPLVRDGMTVDSAQRRAVCIGSVCSQWVPEISGSPAKETGLGWCHDNRAVPSRPDPAKKVTP